MFYSPMLQTNRVDNEIFISILFTILKLKNNHLVPLTGKVAGNYSPVKQKILILFLVFTVTDLERMPSNLSVTYLHGNSKFGKVNVGASVSGGIVARVVGAMSAMIKRMKMNYHHIGTIPGGTPYSRLVGMIVVFFRG